MKQIKFLNLSDQTTVTLASRLDHLTLYVKSHAKNLGVILDSDLQLDKQTSSAKKNSYYQLRIIAKLK